MSLATAGGLHQSSKRKTGSTGTGELSSAARIFCFPSGLSGLASSANLCETDSQMDGLSGVPLQSPQRELVSGMSEESSKPLVIDLFTGLHGWLEAFLEAGYRCVGYDIADMHTEIGLPRPSGIELILRDVMTIHGSELADAACIVASPPCTEFSYMAMPWSRAKQIQGALEGTDPFPDGYTGSRTKAELTALFDACFRIQREAIEAAGHHIPLIVENVRGAQRWVGRAKFHYGSFYLWGDVPALMPMISRAKLKSTGPTDAAQSENHNCHINEMRDALKNPGGGSWDRSRPSHTTDHSWDSGTKTTGHANIRDGHTHTPHLTNQRESDGVKADGSGWTEKGSLASHNRLVSNQAGLKVPGIKLSEVGFNVAAAQRYRDGSLTVDDDRLVDGRKGLDGKSGIRNRSSDPRRSHGNSNSRKAASALIAKIPAALARHIARCYKPHDD